MWSSRFSHYTPIVDFVHALTQAQQSLGTPAAGEEGTPRAHVADTLRYLTNQQSRMRYNEYRRQGLPLTSNHIESTIKQINRRMKGTEKFWSVAANPMLTLVADSLGPPETTTHFWTRRHQRLACCHQTA